MNAGTGVPRLGVSPSPKDASPHMNVFDIPLHGRSPAALEELLLRTPDAAAFLRTR